MKEKNQPPKDENLEYWSDKFQIGIAEGESTCIIRQRKYMPTFSELVDRMTICQLKSIFMPESKKEYDQEIEEIKHDIDLIIEEKDVKLTSEMIRAIAVIMLSNRYIWENESKAREGTDQNLHLLKITHSINGVRNNAKNVISKELGERVDLKIDCLAAELKTEVQNWDIYEN